VRAPPCTTTLYTNATLQGAIDVPGRPYTTLLMLIGLMLYLLARNQATLIPLSGQPPSLSPR
jgi:hypothetical protein